MKRPFSRQTLLIILGISALFIGIGALSAQLSLKNAQSDAVPLKTDVDKFHTTDESTMKILEEIGINIRLIPPDINSRTKTLFGMERARVVAPFVVRVSYSYLFPYPGGSKGERIFYLSFFGIVKQLWSSTPPGLLE